MKILGKLLGGTLIVAGTTLGAGLLAIPITSAHLGFTMATLLMVGVCVLMTYTALVTIEINFYYNHAINISSAVEGILGPWARSLGSFSLVLLYYALLAAYIAGGSTTLKGALSGILQIPISDSALAVVYTVVFAGFIYATTRAVDYFNRFLFTLKVIFFFIMIWILLPTVTQENLFSTTTDFGPFWITIPVFITAFGFHGSLHSVVDYIGLKPKALTFACIVGSLIPLAMYLSWEFVTVGTLPLFGEFSFEKVYNNQNHVGTFIEQLNAFAPGKTIGWAVNVFTTLAIATSFLGVGLGLFDFFAQKAHFANNLSGRMKSLLITFLIPLAFALFYARGFVFALGFAGVALTIIAVILPTLALLKIRRIPGYIPRYKVPGGSTALYTALIAGFVVIFSLIKALVG